jgi:hypothetical protein
MLSKYLRGADTSLLNLTSRFATKLNISDTASMLTNYLRSGIASSTYQTKLNGTGFVKASGSNITYDNSSYLRTNLADSTYLKLTGGTLTGALNVNGTSTLNFTNVYSKNTYVPFNVGIGEQSILNVGAYLRGGTVMLFPDSNLVSSSANLFLANSNVLGVEFSAFGSGLRNYSKQGGDNKRNSLALYTSDIGQQNTNRIYINYNGDIGINDDTPSFKLDVNGTLGVTGAATLTNLAGSGTRMVTASSTGLLSTQAIPSGNSGTVTGVYAAAPIYVSDNTVSPYITIVDASQFVKGVVNETTQTFGGVKTFANTIKLSSTTGTSTSILGKTSDNSVSTVSVGTGLSLTSGTLSSTITVPTERYVWDLGIFAGAADNSAATWDPQYGLNMLVVPTTLNGYCIDSIYARALTCSTCPPAAGDKDYYIGVYKAGNSTRIQTTGMSLQGSQIAMNEYDLKEVNVNYTLTTGDVWWLYLNGTYTSDMLYITGGFVIKKTCN